MTVRKVAKKDSPFMGLNEVMELIPLSRSTIYLMMDEGTFPKSKKLGSRAIFFNRTEINAWVELKLQS